MKPLEPNLLQPKLHAYNERRSIRNNYREVKRNTQPNEWAENG